MRIRNAAGTERPSDARQPAAGTMAAAVAAVLLGACASAPPVVDVAPAVQPPANATVAEVTSRPMAFDERVVTVSGEVNRVFGPRWFSIGGEGFAGGEELLVVGPASLPALVNTLADSLRVGNDLVQVTGEIEVFEEDAVEDRIGVDLDGDWWRAYDAKPVLIMTDLDITPRVDPVITVTPVPVVSSVLLVPVPQRLALAGRAAALAGVEVQTVAGPRSFWVGPTPDQRLFVVMSDSAARRTLLAAPFDIEAGQTVAIAGVIRPIPADLASVRNRWSLSAANEATLRAERVYLDASEVVILDPATR